MAIDISKMKIPEFNTKKELFDFLVQNRSILIARKKEVMKFTESITAYYSHINKNGEVSKLNEPFIPDSDEFKVRVIINTTNLLDSHMDVHIPGIWNKSLSENKMIMHLQEHKMAFDKIISDGKDLKPFVKNYTWGELGYSFDGETQALVFDSIIKKTRNSFMFEQYSKGYVKQHSVGMRYVKLILCINDENYGAEYEAWEKYYPQIINPEMADKKGYFWAVTEGKIIEGSAVPIGSNYATPTLENDLKIEPSEKGTQYKHNEPSEKGTQSWMELINEL